jgi:hypothetical protein
VHGGVVKMKSISPFPDFLPHQAIGHGLGWVHKSMDHRPDPRVQIDD